MARILFFWNGLDVNGLCTLGYDTIGGMPIQSRWTATTDLTLYEQPIAVEWGAGRWGRMRIGQMDGSLTACLRFALYV